MREKERVRERERERGAYEVFRYIYKYLEIPTFTYKPGGVLSLWSIVYELIRVLNLKILSIKLILKNLNLHRR